MENVLYKKTLVYASYSPDGETPTVLYVTRESNGCGIWLYSYDSGLQLLGFEVNGSDRALERGVDFARQPITYLVKLASRIELEFTKGDLYA
jgi:hypothetical protein